MSATTASLSSLPTSLTSTRLEFAILLIFRNDLQHTKLNFTRAILAAVELGQIPALVPVAPPSGATSPLSHQSELLKLLADQTFAEPTLWPSRSPTGTTIVTLVTQDHFFSIYKSVANRYNIPTCGQGVEPSQCQCRYLMELTYVREYTMYTIHSIHTIHWTLLQGRLHIHPDQRDLSPVWWKASQLRLVHLPQRPNHHGKQPHRCCSSPYSRHPGIVNQ